jgi:hypothetical protein
MNYIKSKGLVSIESFIMELLICFNILFLIPDQYNGYQLKQLGQSLLAKIYARFFFLGSIFSNNG